MLSTTTTSSPTTTRPGPTTARPDLAVGLERIANALTEELGDLWSIQRVRTAIQNKSLPVFWLNGKRALRLSEAKTALSASGSDPSLDALRAVGQLLDALVQHTSARDWVNAALRRGARPRVEILMPSSAAPETGADLRVTIIEPDGAERLVFTGHAPAQIAPVN